MLWDHSDGFINVLSIDVITQKCYETISMALLSIDVVSQKCSETISMVRLHFKQ